MSLFDNQGNEIKRKIIFVNEPLNFENLVIYQTDWDIVGLKLSIDNQKVFQIPLKKITKGGNRFWLGSINVDKALTTNLNVVANDLTGKILVYDSRGILLQELGLGESMKNSNLDIKFLDFITSTGLQIKSDPGINVVYFSFLLLILSIYISFFTYSQIWLVELPEKIKVGGNSNRSVLFFQEDFRKIIRRSINT